MADPRRILRINSLLKEVISGVITLDLKHYHIPELFTVTKVDTSRDLQYAKVYVSLINGSEEEKEYLVEELQKCAPKISRIATKKVSLRFFPALTFKIDNSIDEYMKIDDLLSKVRKENPEADTAEEIVEEE